MWAGYVAGFFLAAFAYGCDNKAVVLFCLIAAIIIFFAAMIQAFIFCVCPKCGYSFMKVRGELPDYCPGCGEELSDGKKHT